MSALSILDCLRQRVVPWKLSNDWTESQRIPDDLRLMVVHALEHQVELSPWFDWIKSNTHDSKYILNTVVPEALLDWRTKADGYTETEWLRQFKFFLDSPCFDYFKNSDLGEYFLTSIAIEMKVLKETTLRTQWAVTMLEYPGLPPKLLPDVLKVWATSTNTQRLEANPTWGQWYQTFEDIELFTHYLKKETAPDLGVALPASTLDM